MLQKIRNFTFYALLLTTLFGVPVFAVQDRVTVDRQIHFPRGSISASVSKRIVRGTTHNYRVRARAGQEMAVVLKTGNKTSFTISAREAGILEGADGVRRTLIELPESGEYLIQIGTDATANYTLEVTIH